MVFIGNACIVVVNIQRALVRFPKRYVLAPRPPMGFCEGFSTHVAEPPSRQPTFAYDALGRLRESVASSTMTRFLYDGVQVIGEFNGFNVMQRRCVFGPGINKPWSGTKARAQATAAGSSATNAAASSR